MYLQNKGYLYYYPFLIQEMYNNFAFVSRRSLMRDNPTTIITKEIKYQGPYIQEDLKYPEIHGIPNRVIENDINNSIKSDVMEFKRQMEEAAKEHADEATAAGRRVIPYIISSIYETTYNKNNIISIAMIYHENLEGKNSFIKAPYNFDITTGKALSLADLFILGVNYKSLINREIREQLSRNSQMYLPGTIESFRGIAEDQPFYLQNGNLVVFFGFHEIAPTEAQIPVFKIPLRKFGRAIKPEMLI